MASKERAFDKAAKQRSAAQTATDRHTIARNDLRRWAKATVILGYIEGRCAAQLAKSVGRNAAAGLASVTRGRLLGITPRGWFHVQRLHLNRPLLIEMRRLRCVARAQKDELSRAREAETRLRQENAALQGETTRLRAAIVELLRRGER